VAVDLITELQESFAKRQQKVKDIANRKALYSDPRLPARFRTPEAIARLNSLLPESERLPLYANPAEVALSAAGQATGMLGDAVGALVPQPIEDMLGAVGSAVMSTAPAQAAGELILDFSEANPRTAENLGNVFNVVSAGTGGGLIKAGAKANKGAWAAGVENYIDNFYGNDKPDVDPTELEKTLGAIAVSLKDQKVSDKNVALAGKKLSGFMKWGQGGAAAAIDSFLNPYSRALYRNTGISRKAQKTVDDLLFKNKGNPSKRDIDKAVAQVIYNRHILEQSDRKGEIGAPLFEIDDYANIQGYKPDTLNNFISGAKATKTNTAGGQKVSTPTSVLKTAYSKINKAWGNLPDSKRRLIFKEPSGGSSGDHLKDIAYKHPANKAIREVISKNKGRMTTEKLWSELKKLSDKRKGTDDAFQITQTLDEVKKDGLWVQTGLKGTAVVEGGINGLMKVLPNGRAIAFMSDKHDFLEKLPFVGKFLEKALPNQLMAVSGPMHLDIMGTKWAEEALQKQGKRIEKREKTRPVKREDRARDIDVLQNYVDARPTAGQLLRGFDPVTGTGLLATTSGNNEE
jgi:hypothetical protein